MHRSIFVFGMIALSIFTGFIGMVVGGGDMSLAIIGFLLPTVGLLSCWYYDWSKK